MQTQQGVVRVGGLPDGRHAVGRALRSIHDGVHHAELAQHGQGLCRGLCALPPAGVAKLDAQRVAREVLQAMLQVFDGRFMAEHLGCKLKVDQTQLAVGPEGYQTGSEPAPQFFPELLGHVLVDHPAAGTQGLLDVFWQYVRTGPLPGEQAEGFYVEHKPWRRALSPVLGRSHGRDGVVTGVHLDQVELRSVKTQPRLGRLRALGVEPAALQERLVCPGCRSDQQRHGCLRGVILHALAVKKLYIYPAFQPRRETMELIETTYTVTLRDYPEELPARERIAAETRYAKALEKQLGGPEQVAAALDTMTNLEESPPEVVSPGDLTLLKAWGKASVAAKQAGFRDLGEGEGAYFEVRLV